MKFWILLGTFFYSLCLLIALPLLGTGSSGSVLPPSVSSSPSSLPSQPEPATFRVLDRESEKVYTFSERDFVLYTVAAELYPSFEVETIKAQAVATYTYYSVLRTQRRENPKEELLGADFENVPSTFPESYSLEGLRKRWDEHYDTYLQKFSNAVDAVLGEVLIYDNEPAHTVYHAISFGKTEDASVLWGGKYPYLTTVDSPGDILQNGYLSTVTVTEDELTQALQTQYIDFSPTDKAENWISTPICSDAGTVLQLQICNKVFTGGEIRRALGLRSACFEVTFEQGSFIFTVKGYGHSVGLSQCGANYMAQQGHDYRSILQHYYPGTVLQ